MLAQPLSCECSCFRLCWGEKCRWSNSQDLPDCCTMLESRSVLLPVSHFQETWMHPQKIFNALGSTKHRRRKLGRSIADALWFKLGGVSMGTDFFAICQYWVRRNMIYGSRMLWRMASSVFFLWKLRKPRTNTKKKRGLNGQKTIVWRQTKNWPFSFPLFPFLSFFFNGSSSSSCLISV